MASPAHTLDASSARKALLGFFLSGLLFSFPGAILPGWDYHRHYDYTVIGNHFLAVNIGILLSVKIAQELLKRHRSAMVMALSCVVACIALVFLSFVGPPVPAWWRMGGLLLVGSSVGMLNTAVFQSISPAYTHDPAATTNMSGALFGLGCVVMALLVAGTFYVYTVPSILFLVAIFPAMFAVLYARSKFEDEPPPAQPTIREAFAGFKSLGAVLFTLLLFFQFGNEWSIAGWLALFLIQRLGINPASSLIMLAFYWLALMIGRMAAQLVMSRMSHAKLLLSSVLAALLGCTILLSTDNLFGAGVGILLVGGGFAPIYPLVVGMIGSRFPYYHPGFFNGIFSFALTGGLLAPWTLGYIAAQAGIQAVMALPFVGTCMVFLLLIMIWAETKLTAPPAVKANGA